MRRLLVGLALLPAALAALVGIEIVIALRREYLPVAPVLEIKGTFGPVDSAPLRFVVLGDSSAAGIGAGSAEDSYPAVLARRLGEDGFKVELDGFGISGARLAGLESQVDEAISTKPDLVLIAIGANDVTHATRIPRIREQLTTAIKRLRETGAEVVVAGVPDMRARAFLEPLRSIAGWRGRAVTRTIQAVAREQDISFIPLASRTARYFGESPDGHFSTDGFHPSAGGYARWAEAMYPEVKTAASRKKPVSSS